MFCTTKRAASTTKLFQKVWKLTANSCYGKFLERTRNRLKCFLTKTGEEFEKHSSNQHFRCAKIISENLVIVYQGQECVKLDKALPVGFSILEHSKNFMYKKFYDDFKPLLGKVELLATDTDSFIIEVKHPAGEDPLEKLDTIMDYSNYDQSHPKFSASRKNALGYFKDELQGKKLLEYVGIRSKCYALRMEGDELITKAKSVREGYKAKIPFSLFKKCINEINRVSLTQYHITSKNHNVKTTKVKKVALSSMDDKRYLRNCGVHSFAFGSSQIEEDGECYQCSGLGLDMK